MQFQPVFAARSTHRGHFGDRPSVPSVVVVGVLDADDLERGEVRIVGADRLAYLIGSDDAVLASRDARGQPGERGVGSGLPVIHVRLLLKEHLVSPVGVGHQGAGIAHRARRHVECGFHAHFFGRQFLQAVDRWVFAVHIVAQWRTGHGLSHGLGRQGNRVAAQVYCLVAHVGRLLD